MGDLDFVTITFIYADGSRQVNQYNANARHIYEARIRGRRPVKVILSSKMSEEFLHNLKMVMHPGYPIVIEYEK